MLVSQTFAAHTKDFCEKQTERIFYIILMRIKANLNNFYKEDLMLALKVTIFMSATKSFVQQIKKLMKSIRKLKTFLRF